MDTELSERINSKKKRLDSLRPLPQHTLQSLRDSVFLEWTYHSNAIEGNTLSLKETKVVLEGITVGGKTLKEHFEVINHEQAILYIEDIVHKKEPLTEWQIRNIHALILKNIDDRNAGVYRKENVLISGATHIPPDYLLVPEQMRDLIIWHDENNFHPVETSAMLHAQFVKIHPFTDGNGRTARLLMNFELMKNGFPPVVIRKEDRLNYYDFLDNAHVTGDYSDFIAMIGMLEEEMLDFYLKIL